MGFPLLVLAGLWAGHKGLRAAALRALSPTLELIPERPKQGQRMRVRLEVKPIKDLHIENIEMVIECQRVEDTTHHRLNQFANFVEVVCSIAGNQPCHTYGKVTRTSLCKELTLFPLNRDFRRGEPQLLEHELDVPSGGLCSSKFDDVIIGWTLELRIKISGALGRPVLTRDLEVLFG